MKWIKRGLIFNPIGQIPWASHSAMQPTPILIEDKIRIFTGFRDDKGVSRIGWVDVDINDPTKVLGFSSNPVLDIGEPGTFDDNGVTPTAVVHRDNAIYLYYAGYQIVEKVRFMVFTGLAISTDNGNTFHRLKKTPLLDRTDDEILFRVIHTIFFENGKWKAWYGGGSFFIQGLNKTLPVYDVRYIESLDGLTFPDSGKVVLKNQNDEYRVGKPHVIKFKEKYLMFYGYSTETQPYRLGFAESMDGINWNRRDELLNVEYNENDFDSSMSAFPSTIFVGEKLYLFYNGNDYGREGIGLLEYEDA